MTTMGEGTIRPLLSNWINEHTERMNVEDNEFAGFGSVHCGRVDVSRYATTEALREAMKKFEINMKNDDLERGVVVPLFAKKEDIKPLTEKDKEGLKVARKYEIRSATEVNRKKYEKIDDLKRQTGEKLKDLKRMRTFIKRSEELYKLRKQEMISKNPGKTISTIYDGLGPYNKLELLFIEELRTGKMLLKNRDQRRAVEKELKSRLEEMLCDPETCGLYGISKPNARLVINEVRASNEVTKSFVALPDESIVEFKTTIKTPAQRKLERLRKIEEKKMLDDNYEDAKRVALFVDNVCGLKDSEVLDTVRSFANDYDERHGIEGQGQVVSVLKKAVDHMNIELYGGALYERKLEENPIPDEEYDSVLEKHYEEMEEHREEQQAIQNYAVYGTFQVPEMSKDGVIQGQGLFDEIKEVSENLKKTGELKEKATEILELIRSIDLPGFVAGLKNGIVVKLEVGGAPLTDLVSKVAIVVLNTIVVVLALKKGEYVAAALVVASTAVSLGIPQAVFEAVVNVVQQIKTYSGKDNSDIEGQGMQGQGAGEILDVIKNLFKSLIPEKSSFGFAASFEGWAKKMMMANTAMNFFEKIFYYLKKTFYWLASKVTGHNYDIEDFGEITQSVRDLEAMQTWYTENSMGERNLQPENLKSIVRAVQDYKKKLYSCALSTRNHPMLVNVTRNAEAMYASAMGMLSIATSKNSGSPIIVFEGKSKTGKSTAVQVLESLVKKELFGNALDPIDTYHMNMESEFYDGYHEQPFVFVDDCMQGTDPDVFRRLGLFIIHAATGVPFLLPKAEIGDAASGGKGFTKYDSKVVFMSVNDFKMSFAGFDKEAILRRITYFVEFKDDELYDDRDMTPEQVTKFWRERRMMVSTRCWENGGLKTEPIANVNMVQLAALIGEQARLKGKSANAISSVAVQLANEYTPVGEAYLPTASTIPKGVRRDVVADVVAAMKKNFGGFFEQIRTEMAAERVEDDKGKLKEIDDDAVAARLLAQNKEVISEIFSRYSDSDIVGQGKFTEIVLAARDEGMVMTRQWASRMKMLLSQDDSTKFDEEDENTWKIESAKWMDEALVPRIKDKLILMKMGLMDSVDLLGKAIKSLFDDPIVVAILSFIAMACAAWGIGMILNLVFKRVVNGQSEDTRKGKMKKKNIVTYVPKKGMQGQSSDDKNAFDVAIDMGQRNVWKLEIQYEVDGETYVGRSHILMVDARTGIVARHCLRVFSDERCKNVEVMISCKEGIGYRFPDATKVLKVRVWNSVYDPNKKEIVCIEDKKPCYDLATIYFPDDLQIQLVSNQRKKFVTNEDLTTLDLSRMFLVGKDSHYDTFISEATTGKIDYYTDTVNSTLNGVDQAEQCVVGFQYRCYNEVGMCGSAIVVCDSRKPRKLLGIHHAGRESENIGFGVVITQELLAINAPEEPGRFPTIDLGSLPDSLVLRGQAKEGKILNTNFVKWTVPNSHPEEIPSGLFVIHELQKHVKVPGQPNNDAVRSVISAHLTTVGYDSTDAATVCHKWTRKDGVVVDPIQNSVSKMAKGLWYRKKLYTRERKELAIHLLRIDRLKYDAETTFSEYEVVCGAPDCSHSNPIRMTTSPGAEEFPGVKKNTAFYFRFNQLGQAIGYTDDFRKRVDCIKEMWRDNLPRLSMKVGEIPIYSLNTLCMKSERRPKEKVLNGNERMFNFGSKSMLCATKELEGRIVSESVSVEAPFTAAGTVLEQMECTSLIKKHTSPYLSNKHIVADARGFDVSDEVQRLMDFQYTKCTVQRENDEYIFKKYNYAKGSFKDPEILFKMRLREGMDCVSPVCVIELNGRKFLLLMNGVVSSGSLKTLFLNDHRSCENVFIIYLYWCDEKDKPQLRSLSKFLELVKISTHGDDLWVTVHRDIADTFNSQYIGEHAYLVHTEYTSARKNEPLRDVELMDVEFLKCAPKLNNHVWTMALQPQVIRNMVHWVTKGLPQKEACAQVVEAALRQWARHGRKIFDENYTILRDAFISERIISYFPKITYDEIMNKY